MTTILTSDDVLRHSARGPEPLPMPRAYWKIPWIALREWLTPRGRPRQPEPMIMNHPDSAAGFHEGADVSPGMCATYDLSARCLSALLPEGGRLLDLGCGSGQAITYLAMRRPDITVTGVDLAPRMLEHARELTSAASIGDRVRVTEADITDLPEAVSSVSWDAVSCVWTLHHLPDQDVLAAALRQIAAMRRSIGCAVWILDFQRLKSPHSFRAGISALEPAVQGRLRQDATASEAAAFTSHEIRQAVVGAELQALRGGCLFPVPWLQAHWASAVGQIPGPSRCWQEISSGSPARLDATLMRYGFRDLPI